MPKVADKDLAAEQEANKRLIDQHNADHEKRTADRLNTAVRKGSKFVTVNTVNDTLPGRPFVPHSDAEANRLLALGAIKIDYEPDPVLIDDPTLLPDHERAWRETVLEATRHLEKNDPAHFNPETNLWRAEALEDKIGGARAVTDSDIEIAMAAAAAK